jgi:serine/threonine protein kinase
MDYIRGEDLAALFRDLCSRGLRFPRSVVLDLGIAITSALASAWEATDGDGEQLRIVHRDMKPHNVLVSVWGDVKVADFGIAKAAPDVSVTATGILKGTPNYLAPEIWSGSRDFAPCVDLFGVGVILWELVAGRRFYGKVPLSRVLELMAQRTPRDEVNDLGGTFPQIAPVLQALLARDPAFRSGDARKVSQELARIRDEIGAPGDLGQFMALVRAARSKKPVDGTASIDGEWEDASDWGPLLAVRDCGAAKLEPEQAVQVMARTEVGLSVGQRSVGSSVSLAEPIVEFIDESLSVVDDHEPRTLGFLIWLPWLAAGGAGVVLLALLRARGYLG